MVCMLEVSSCLAYFLCQKVSWLEFLHVQSICQSFGIRWFHWVLYFVFCRVYSLCQRVSSGIIPVFVRVLGV